MLFEHLVVEDFKASDVPVKTPPTREEYIPKDLHKLLIDRAVAVGNKMKTSGMERIREHNSYSGLQSEKYLTVLARNFLNDLNMDLFEIMFVYLTRTTIGKSFFEHCYLVMKGSDQTLFEGNEVADFVRAWREAILPVNGFTRLKEKINAKSTISQKLPSPYKFNQYHAAIVPFIKYSLKINPITATNITAISPCLAMKLLHLCDQSSVNQFNNNYYKLWWDDRRVEGSKGIITLSRNGSLLKRDILVLLLSPIKLKDLFKSNDDKDKEVLTNIIPEIQQIMTNNPANYCSSDLLAMKEILDPSFKRENQSSNILSTLAIMNNIIYSNSLDTKSKTKYIINLIPPKMRKQLIEALSSENLMHIDYENILTQDERTLCESNNIGMKYAYLLGNDRTYYDQLSYLLEM